MPTMKNKFRQPTQEETGVLIALIAVIFGGWVRLFIPGIAGFPVNDGGLFYVMVRAIQENGYRLPGYIQYNGLNIPFAYPPLAFYVAAFLGDLLHADITAILRWLPAIVLIFTIIAFYGLAKAIFNSKLKAGIATFLFAFTPRAMTWLIMGGGLTRSFGQLFLILAITNVYRLFTEGSRKYLLLSIALSALVVLTHPEAAIHTVAFSLLFWIFQGRDKSGALNAVWVAIGTILLTSIWWLPLLLRLGPDPILSATQTGLHNLLLVFYAPLMTFTDEPLMTIIAVLAVIGVAASIAEASYLLPIWLLLPFIVEPRGAATVATLPLAMLAGTATSELILSGLARFEGEMRKAKFENPFQSRAVQFFAAFVGLYLLGSAFYFGTQLAGTTVSKENRAAFAWVAANTPPDSRFLILTGDQELFCDSTQEWFPALAQRISLTTIQGREWLGGKRFTAELANLQGLQNCLKPDSPLECIERQASQMDASYDYIYITRKAANKNYCRASGAASRGETLIESLKKQGAETYTEVYETETVAIFNVRETHP